MKPTGARLAITMAFLAAPSLPARVALADGPPPSDDEQLDQAQNELEQKREDLRSTIQQWRIAADAQEKVAKQLEGARKRVEDLEAEKERLIAEGKSKSEALETTQEKLRTARREEEELKSSLDKLAAEIELAKATNASLDEERDALLSDIDRIRERIREKGTDAAKDLFIVKASDYTKHAPSGIQEREWRKRQRKNRREGNHVPLLQEIPLHGGDFGDGLQTGDLRMRRQRCAIRVSTRGNGPNTLSERGVTDIYIRTQSDQKRVGTAGKSVDLNSSTAAFDYDDICAFFEGSFITDLELVVSFKSSNGTQHEATYPFSVSAPINELDIAVAFYFAGGDLRSSSEITSFTVLPALKFGYRVNIPPSNRVKDFYFQFNAVGGPAFVASQTKRVDVADDSGSDQSVAVQDPKAKRFTFVAGGAVEFGKYVEIGAAYDTVNKTWMVILTPGRLLSADVFRF